MTQIITTNQKQSYLRPSIKVVEFQVEQGFNTSSDPVQDDLAHTNDIQQGTEYNSSYFDYSF